LQEKVIPEDYKRDSKLNEGPHAALRILFSISQRFSLRTFSFETASIV